MNINVNPEDLLWCSNALQNRHRLVIDPMLKLHIQLMDPDWKPLAQIESNWLFKSKQFGCRDLREIYAVKKIRFYIFLMRFAYKSFTTTAYYSYDNRDVNGRYSVVSALQNSQEEQIFWQCQLPIVLSSKKSYSVFFYGTEKSNRCKFIKKYTHHQEYCINRQNENKQSLSAKSKSRPWKLNYTFFPTNHISWKKC